MGPVDDPDGAKWNAMLRPADVIAARIEGRGPQGGAMSLKWTSDHEVFEADADAIAEAHNQAVDIARAEGIREGKGIRDAEIERLFLAAVDALRDARKGTP